MEASLNATKNFLGYYTPMVKMHSFHQKPASANRKDGEHALLHERVVYVLPDEQPYT